MAISFNRNHNMIADCYIIMLYVVVVVGCKIKYIFLLTCLELGASDY